jgi:hypothetical protein
VGKQGRKCESNPRELQAGDSRRSREDATRAALLAIVRLHELGALRYYDESGAAVHRSAGHPSPQGSSGRRSCGQARAAAQTAPANNMGQSVCIDGDME